MCFYNHLVRRKWCSKRSLKSKWLCVDILQLKLIMKEIVCTVCESKEPVICCATCEALYCQNCKVSYHEKVKLSICNLKLVLFVGLWVKHLGKIICQFEEYVVLMFHCFASPVKIMLTMWTECWANIYEFCIEQHIICYI